MESELKAVTVETVWKYQEIKEGGHDFLKLSPSWEPPDLPSQQEQSLQVSPGQTSKVISIRPEGGRAQAGPQKGQNKDFHKHKLKGGPDSKP